MGTAMKKTVFLAFVFVFFISKVIFPQSVSQMPEVEPFKIRSGSSFSASVPRPKQKPILTATISQDISEALEIINENHVAGKKIDYNELTKNSLNALLRTLDPHSHYFDAAEYQELLNDQRSEYFGIGATIANYQRNNLEETFVISTFPDSPAHRSGLRFGDKIIAVNGETVKGKSSTYVRDKVRGKRGTIARLMVERADTRKTEVVEIKRNRVPQPSILDAYLLRENVGYIDLTSGFNYTTFDELEVAIKALNERGMNSLVLDLRGNPGGIVEQAVKIAEKFLPAGETILTQRGRLVIDNRIWKSNNKNPITIPLVVLVNNQSASASEIVVGALQDYDRALVIGEKTFGKGLVQSVINLPYNSGLTLTTARYFTPSGRSIQRNYSDGNLYDYYNKKISLTEEDKKKSATKTASGRTIYGGDGITPDEAVKSEVLTKNQIELLDPIFFFARELVGGRIRNFENLRLNLPVQFGRRIRPDDLIISDELFKSFKEFVSQSNDWKVSSEKIEAEKAFIKTHLRFHMATASFGIVAANQVLLEKDLQLMRALAALPRAEQLALYAKKSRENK